MRYRLGVDVGGTFTDVLLHDSDEQRIWLAKTPSTPQDQSVGVIDGIRLAADKAAIEPGELDAILHGTTVATNAVLERRGALVGLIVTEGYRQILHLAEAWTPGPLFGFMVYEKPEPLTDTRYVREVPERIAADGSIVEPIDEDVMDLAQLRATMVGFGEAWSKLLATEPDPGERLTRHRPDGSTTEAPVSIRLAQVVHHGTDHRSQICTALTSIGVEPPFIDVWDYGVQDGRVTETEPTS